MQQKLQALLQQLNSGLVEREQTLKTTLLAVLAGENPVLIGPPGTGKSLMARRIAEALAQDSSDYFEYLLTKFSTPEEIFGPLSISELKADRFKRNTAGYLPTVKLAFLDEIFKASSSILNALLTILNERIYHNGAEPQRVPLQALIAASNELPSDQEELGALYDRFLVRVFVDYVSEAGLPRLFEPMTEPQWSAANQLQRQDLQRIHTAAHAVALPPEIAQAIQRIWTLHRETFKEDRRESLSDRRLKKIIHLLRVSAATNGRAAVDLSDVLLLKDCLWNHPDNAVKVRELVMKTLRSFSREMSIDSTKTESIANQEPMAAAVFSAGQLGALINGFKGRGTKKDPLLIENIDQFLDLARPEIGQQDYYFQQTADLDIIQISTWPKINFKGKFDGQGYSIKYKLKGNYKNFYEILIKNNELNHELIFNKSSNGIEKAVIFLFKEIHDSTILNVNLVDCWIAQYAKNTKFHACKSDQGLAERIENGELFFCESKYYLTLSASSTKIKSCLTKSIANNIKNCHVSYCQSSDPLVLNEIKDSAIKDCLVTMNFSSDDREITPRGGITTELNNSSIKKCFITGKWSGMVEFSGIAYSAKNSSKIEKCVVGDFRFKGNRNLWNGRISCDQETSYFEKNVAIDTIPITKESIEKSINTLGMGLKISGFQKINNNNNNFHDGESIAAARLNQHYLEHTLGWDFDTVWAWDDQKNYPVLRQVGVQADTSDTPAASAQANTVDLLTQQIRANIWL